MLTFRQQPAIQATTDADSRYVGLQKEAVTVLQSSAEEGITLEALSNKLAEANPSFANLLRQTVQEMAPLSKTSNGEVTVTSLRMATGLTQKEFAVKVNWKQPNVSAMESGQRANPTRDTMRLMCKVLDCSMDTLDAAIENSKNMLEEYITKQEQAQQVILETQMRKYK